MAVSESMDLQRKQMIVKALCRHFALDPNPFMENISENDLKSLYSNISKSSGKESSLQSNDEVLKWVAYVESFPSKLEECFSALEKLNGDLVTKSVLSGNGFTPSAADVVVFSVLHASVSGLSKKDNKSLPHVMRWMDYIQNKEGLSDLFGSLAVEKKEFEFVVPKTATITEADSKPKKGVQSNENPAKSEMEPNCKKNDPGKKATKDKDAAQGKRKTSEVEVADKDNEVTVRLLNILVGLIRKAWKHPSADSLLVEEIDVGEAKPRQVVSGLAKFCSPDELTNRLVVLITNVKPGKLRDVLSEGLVLCASNEDHTVVEPLRPPEGAKPGECISFSGIDGKPEDVLNPKKKQLEKITPHLFTDDKGVATYKGVPFMTSAGPCTSSIPKASIK